MLDTKAHIETPEGALLPLSPAGICVRACAYALDWGIRALVLAAFAMVLSQLGGLGKGLLLMAYFAMEWFYPVLFEVWNQGVTPGKKIMGLRVVHDDGTPVGFTSSLLRNLLMAVDFLPLLYAAGVVSSLSNAQFKRIGDLAAGTLVVYRPTPFKSAQLDESLGKRPLPAGLTTAEQRALVSFAERCPQLTPARQDELAQLLAPVLAESCSVLAVKQMANQIAGTAKEHQAR
jgi:uncharacterized RDD family membrane protein YckC